MGLLTTRLAARGFDLPRLTFATRTALASCAALAVAAYAGLDHPQWSAMTVWAASQPTRGQLIEKSLFRVAGTLSGTTAGVVLMVLARGQPLLLSAGLALWIALCAGIGNLQRGFVAYGTMLAGYSASMVALLDSAHPDHVFAIGADRLATILVGVLLALVMGLLFTPKQAEQESVARLRHISTRVLRHLMDGLARPGDPALAEAQYALLAEMAAIEESLEPHGAGSLRSRAQMRAFRALLMDLIPLLLLARRAVPSPANPTGALETALAALEAGVAAPQAIAALKAAATAAADDPRLADGLAHMAERLAPVLGAPEEQVSRTAHPVILHRDWVGARRTFVRAGVTMLAMGTFWIATGWSGGPFLLLGVSIMISLFSTFENPGHTMGFVAAGQVIGVAGALACRFLAWPFATDMAGIVLLTMPFILLSSLFFSHRRTLPMAFDYAMVSLLLLHPAYPPTGTFVQMANAAVAVIAAPLVAMAAYRLLFPVDAGRRLDTLIAMMVDELQQMARSPRACARRHIWRARLYHRLLSLVRLAERAGTSRKDVVDGGLAVLATGSAILALRQALEASPPLPPPLARRFTAALGRLQQLGRNPPRAATALAHAARSAGHRPEAGTLAGAARAITLQEAFFRRHRPTPRDGRSELAHGQ